ncbi:hypothetical protein F444_13779 [Phytophthora nicotianae P1976]|uniref:RxLR effector protein n=1 Tax=Phytophthora nicotianae P1976 TaxID=1317066 RepID=A0A080ZSS2_PHYNI|nr:hypothetical protein F444_13779 [Phytophthora nicotianae P1976]
MRFQSAMILTAAFLAQCLAHPDQAYRPTITTPHAPDSLFKSTVATSSKRFLRFDPAVRDTAGNDEERVGPSWLSIVDDLTQKMTTTALTADEAQLKTWIQSQIHPHELFGILNLGKRAAQLDDNPDFVQWLRLVEAYRAKNGKTKFSDLNIYYLLLRTNSAEQLKTLPEALRQTPGLIKMGKSMEKSLSGEWIRKTLQENTYPTMVYNTLRLKEAGSKLDETPMFRQWLKYVEKYRNEKGALFGNTEMLLLFKNTMPEEDVINLLQRLRSDKGMRSHADKMQRLMFYTSKTSHTTMADVWLKFRETPEEVFNILRLAETTSDAIDDNPLLVQWLKYTQTYREKIDKNAFSDAEAMQYFRKAKLQEPDWELV